MVLILNFNPRKIKLKAYEPKLGYNRVFGDSFTLQ
jgi:hypothetical protein